MRKRLGEILVAKGYLSGDQVQEALKIQREAADSKKIGQILIAHGMASPEQVDEGLQAQN